MTCLMSVSQTFSPLDMGIMTTMLLAYCRMKRFVYQLQSIFGNMHVERANLMSKSFADWVLQGI